MNEKEEIKLKNCPFCGSHVDLQENECFFQIVCSVDCPLNFSAMSSSEDISKKWNARTPDADLKAACEKDSKRLCSHHLNTEHCSWCNRPQHLKITPEIIRALFYLAEMPRTHDTWEIVDESPKKAKLILEFIQGQSEELLDYFGTERQVTKQALERARR